jgi:spore coat protein A
MSTGPIHPRATRRRFLEATAAGVAGFILSSTTARWVYAACERLDPTTQPQFVENLTIPAVIDATSGGSFHVTMQRATQELGLVGPGGGSLRTNVWGYGLGNRVTYLGPTFVAMKDVDVDVRWDNQISRQSLVPVDATVHKGDPKGPDNAVSLVTHLHGGRNESPSDGIPEAWFTQNWSDTGPQWVKETYHYPNAQEAGTLWYHDHSLGITRTNVYGGLAGFYLLRDANEQGLISRGILPSGAYEVGLAIQDRCFEENGELFLPASPEDIELVDSAVVFDPDNVLTDIPFIDDTDTKEIVFERPIPDPTIVTEFFGDFILVNGKIWPKLQVTPDLYRIRVLNGSDSRFYILRLQDAPRGENPGDPYEFFVIGSDAGFLGKPVQVSELLIAPGERYDLVVDFETISDGNTNVNFDVYLNNWGPDQPFSSLPIDPDDLANADTTGRVMKFEVRGDMVDSAPGWRGAQTSLRPGGTFKVTGNSNRTRKLFLFEGLDEFGRLQPLLGTEMDTGVPNSRNSRAWFEDVTEDPDFDAVETWEVYNTTEDAHPIHLHLVSFELVSRRNFAMDDPRDVPQPMASGSYGVGKDVDVSTIRVTGQVRVADHEKAPKDTGVMLPGTVTTIKMRFSPPNHEKSGDGTIRYVWHCHILSHEDHEMMRPYVVED